MPVEVREDDEEEKEGVSFADCISPTKQDKQGLSEDWRENQREGQLSRICQRDKRRRKAADPLTAVIRNV